MSAPARPGSRFDTRPGVPGFPIICVVRPALRRPDPSIREGL